MEYFNNNISEIIDFIFKKPEVVLELLKKNNYQIETETATIQLIDELTFNALENRDELFAEDLALAIINDAVENQLSE